MNIEKALSENMGRQVKIGFGSSFVYCDTVTKETFDVIESLSNEYLEKKQAEDPNYKYNLFQIIVTALLKTLTLRPEMNRFITNYHLYQRNEISAAFTIKKVFSEEGGEALAFIHYVCLTLGCFAEI